MNNDGSRMSHVTVEVDKDGYPLEIGKSDEKRFVYVDEQTCIGCQYCSQVAPNTFFMEDDYGRARVFQQMVD